MVVKHYGRVSEPPCFLVKIHRKSSQIANHYFDSKLLRAVVRGSIFSTVESFGFDYIAAKID